MYKQTISTFIEVMDGIAMVIRTEPVFVHKKRMKVMWMPRVALSQEQRRDYKLKSLKKWIKGKMAENDITQKQLGDVLGLSQGVISIMLMDYDKKNPRVKKDPFSYGQLLLMCELFGAKESEKEKLLTM